MGYCGLGNVNNEAFLINKEYIKRDKGVFHPHGDYLVILKKKQHAISISHFSPEHQSPGPLIIRFCNLHRELMFIPPG